MSDQSVLFDNFVKHLNLVVLPSALWGIHVDTLNKFIAVLHVKLVDPKKLIIDKSITLTTKDDTYIDTTVFMNNACVDGPGLESDIKQICDLSKLIHNLHELECCINSTNNDKPNCSKYVNIANSYCESCLKDEDQESINDDIFQSEETKVDCLLVNSYDDNDTIEVKEEWTFQRHVMKKEVLKDTVIPRIIVDKPHNCKICNRGFLRKYNLKLHERVHSGERPYVCSKCGKWYTTKSNLTTHIICAHTREKKHGCKYCDMTFVHPNVLRVHMRKHTGEKPFMCSACGKVFSKNIHLTIHNRIHSGERPHICSICNKGFTTTGNLSSHRKVHHKTFPISTLS